MQGSSRIFTGKSCRKSGSGQLVLRHHRTRLRQFYRRIPCKDLSCTGSICRLYPLRKRRTWRPVNGQRHAVRSGSGISSLCGGDAPFLYQSNYSRKEVSGDCRLTFSLLFSGAYRSLPSRTGISFLPVLPPQPQAHRHGQLHPPKSEGQIPPPRSL